jgi:hypothetical protein
VPNPANQALFEKYKTMADAHKDVSFVGRLANYKYFNMDQSILNALELFDSDTRNMTYSREDDAPKHHLEYTRANVSLQDDDTPKHVAKQSRGSETHPHQTPAEQESTALNAHNKRPAGPRARIAFITAGYGLYEKSLKHHATLSIACDFIGFTDQANIIANNWQVDIFPYHVRVPSKFDTGNERNALSKNQHTFNIAKYYKTYFHHILLGRTASRVLFFGRLQNRSFGRFRHNLTFRRLSHNLYVFSAGLFLLGPYSPLHI